MLRRFFKFFNFFRILNGVILIYKVLANSEENKQLINELPYIKNIPKFGDKWSFIEKYWNNNYEKFD